MRKKLLWTFVGVLTVLVGTGVVFLFLKGTTPQLSYENLVPEVILPYCNVNSAFPGKSRPVSELEKGISGYFPKGDFSGSWAGQENFVNDWYGKFLAAMYQDSLLDVRDINVETYRFLWLRTFHQPILVRVDRNRNEIALLVAELAGHGGYEPGGLVRNDVFEFSQKDWCEMMTLLKKADYWQQPTNIDHRGYDGAEWVLEAVKENRYHIVDRWSPREGDDYREVGLFLLRHGYVDLNDIENEIY